MDVFGEQYSWSVYWIGAIATILTILATFIYMRKTGQLDVDKSKSTKRKTPSPSKTESDNDKKQELKSKAESVKPLPGKQSIRDEVNSSINKADRTSPDEEISDPTSEMKDRVFTPHEGLGMFAGMRCPFSGLMMPAPGAMPGNMPHGMKPDSESAEEENIAEAVEDENFDPVDYMEHIQGEVKGVKARVVTKKIEETMTANQRAEEREVQQNQMEAIFKLMQEQEDKFGVHSMDEMGQQMKLYM